MTDFTRDVERQGEGIPGREGLLQQMRLPQEEFRVAIRTTAPCFIPQFNRGHRHTDEESVDDDAVSPLFSRP